MLTRNAGLLADEISESSHFSNCQPEVLIIVNVRQFLMVDSGMTYTANCRLIYLVSFLLELFLLCVQVQNDV